MSDSNNLFLSDGLQDVIDLDRQRVSVKEHDSDDNLEVYVEGLDEPVLRGRTCKLEIDNVPFRLFNVRVKARVSEWMGPLNVVHERRKLSKIVMCGEDVLLSVVVEGNEIEVEREACTASLEFDSSGYFVSIEFFETGESFSKRTMIVVPSSDDETIRSEPSSTI